MDEATVRAMLMQHFEHAASDPDLAHDMYHDDAVLEFPQSGERFVGVESFREWRRGYPASTVPRTFSAIASSRSSTRSEAQMSEGAGGERASDEKNGPAETRPDDQLVGDDESGYGGAGADDVGAEHARLGNGHNRPPSDQDEDQGV